MAPTLATLLDESIQLELNLAKLYTLFNDQFSEDEEFWWQLSMEERSHAALLQQEKKQPQPLQFFPENLLAKDLDALKANNAFILEQSKRFADAPCSREEALNLALKIEMSAGEAHFQEFMESETGSLTADIFKQLASEDQNHARRIREYMKENGVEARHLD
ncbi:MAG: rubrerythrin family protein [Chlorobiaceae bacterium]|nr:rubrerythrin family protein [Chlorobiales bacterium]NTV25005.1 rubrerythrin family protein [Chlorobiaceae bacterium]